MGALRRKSLETNRWIREKQCLLQNPNLWIFQSFLELEKVHRRRILVIPVLSATAEWCFFSDGEGKNLQPEHDRKTITSP